MNPREIQALGDSCLKSLRSEGEGKEGGRPRHESRDQFRHPLFGILSLSVSLSVYASTPHHSPVVMETG